MMSSEEEADSHAPYSDKLLKKQKRVRQRVDAGEPRNSYSTLATNGLAPARAAHMSGGLYGAIFEGRQHFGLFGPCYAPAEMLNELLGRAPRQEDASDDASGGDMLRDRVLRDILQSQKKGLMRLSPDNNNVLANNNNDEPKEEKRSPERPVSRDSRADLDEALLNLDSTGDSRTSPPPAPPPSEPLLAPKSEPEDRDSDAQRSSPRPLDVKRARVENIVSTMRASPAPQQPQVNGCKKRKLYHPQQHDGAAERYGTSHASSGQTVSDDSEDDGERPPIQQKLVEKNALKSQLRTMQEQLAEMQEKYLQLCNRMGQESETVDNDGASSDVEQIEDPVPKLEPSSPAKEAPPSIPNSVAPNLLSQVMSKMMTAKIQQAHSAAHGHLPPGFNGSLPLMPHLPTGDHMHPPHTHQHLNNAAAMYLNVSQKLFLEQEARMKEANEQQQNNQQQRPQSNQHSPQHRQLGPTPKPPLSSELAERLDAIRSNSGSVGPVSGADLEGLAEVLKSEITASLASLIDSIVTRFVHQRRILGKQSEAAAAAAEQFNKDLMRATRLLDQPTTPKVPDRPSGQMSGNPPVHHPGAPNGVPFMTNNPMFMNHMNGPRAPGGAAFPLHHEAGGAGHGAHMRPPAGMFQAPPKPMQPHFGPMNGHYDREQNPDPSEPLSLVVTPKKKRHKVTDTRITPRTVSRILGEGVGHSPESKFPESPSPRSFPSGLNLPTSVAIANPSLHESQVFSPYSPFFGAGGGLARSPPAPERDSPPLPNAPAMLHPVLLAHHGSPDYLRPHHPHVPHHAAGPHHPHHMDVQDPHSDCNSTDLPYDGIQPTSSTLTPMHLRKAKLMFFWVRYPSSAVLKMYFPDIKFNKNNTAQLVKWFSNFREFYYIQMEKYARQAISEGLKTADDLHVAGDSELYRVLNLHYNRNNHIEVPPNFRYVVEQTLREFFRAIQGGKDNEQSWKKSIYKVISRLDDPVPEYFKSPNFLEQLE
ncbi:homeobox protein prospero isoform X1 [Maniola jurtina]|uniref:homeobox protein prospero isoform X1 n=1 Tax=Maniola jurtina TaxID=191418 RepID=UPI001E68B047|nr:homeobox protein prospero isoform X1 [Maniola jurtina]XP_045776814.1 homeobox protein prospero isoform X1 [Maniola jurtina]XP_045776815.1 homeobox protein prospero isoform X1 [Maniola jurtina]